MTRRLRYALASALTMPVAIALISSAPAAADNADPIIAGFENPPATARPRVWWHWMNGNVTVDGIEKDIAWMERVGIGGLQNFDASLATPQVVDHRLAYMTPDWQQAFRFAAQQADKTGLELAIASSPGWSETGGPWVQPEDGIKKLSWSITDITGGKKLSQPLAMPPAAAGPFQTLTKRDETGVTGGSNVPAPLYRDVGVYAIPMAGPIADTHPTVSLADGRAMDFSLVSDGDYTRELDLGRGTPESPPALLLTYRSVQKIRSATIFMHDVTAVGGSQRFSPVLEANLDGEWKAIAEFEVFDVPTTVSFAPVSASQFRVVFAPSRARRNLSFVIAPPGAIVPPSLAPATGTDPAKLVEFSLSSSPVVDRFESKAGYSITNDYLALKTSANPTEAGVAAQAIVNLTDRLRPDGTLDWVPPKGNWRILRMGWTLTGKTNHPATAEATGLEVDKLDGAAVERYLRHYLDMYKQAAGSDMFGNRGVRALLTDSTEVGAFNWTPRMIDQFKRLRGYDPTPWLPALTGIIIGSRSDTDRFLFDYRRTLGDLHASEHYGTIARVAHEYGLTVYGEAIEDRRAVLGDDMAMRRYADIPMGALWVWNEKAGVRPTLLGDLKGASSVGHFYGKNIVAAESLTSALAPWALGPADLRHVIDLEFALGINRPVIHTSVHQPRDDRKPGLSLMIFGQFFNRHESWAEMARPWVDYMARNSFLLQQGRNVADVAYFYGEEGPLTAITADRYLADVPTRYAYDFINADGLLEGLTVDPRGQLVAPSGNTYRVLYLGGRSQHMTLPVLRRIAELAEKGATVIGEAPTGSPSMADDPAAVKSLIARMWSGDVETRVGKGRVIRSSDIETNLSKIGVAPDVDFGAGSPEVLFVHRRLVDGDLYFIVNRSKRAIKTDVRFRVSGKAPDFLNAVDGQSTPAPFRSDGEVTVVPMDLPAQSSINVLFRKRATTAVRSVAAIRTRVMADLSTDWNVSFQADRGAPAAAQLKRLSSLSENANSGIRYFSGEATYSRHFNMPKGHKRGIPVWLDLGSVGDMAEVRVNGKIIGTVWQKPFRLNVEPALRRGQNRLEVRVANLWVNRLIGDAQPGSGKVTFVTIPTFAPNAPLRASGLIGPVLLLEENPR